MFRSVIASLILGPALLIGSFAWSGYLALGTVFDENRSQQVAEELLENEAVRNQLAANIGKTIEAALPAEVPLSGADVDAAALAVLNDQRVTDLIVESFGATHRAFLGQGKAPETLDLNALAEVAREQLAAVSPEAAALLPDSPDFTVELPTERIPDSSPVKSFLETVVPLFAAVSVVMVLLAFLTASDRPSVLRRAARWALATTAFYLVIGFGIPALLVVVAPAQAEVLGALITALLRTTLPPSVVLGAVGAVLLAASWTYPDGERESRRSQPESEPDLQPQAPPPRTVTLAAPPTTHVPPARPQPRAPPQQPVTPPSTPVVPAPAPSPLRSTLPTRAAPADVMSAPATTGTHRSSPPHWVEPHGWVLAPDDERPVPPNARYVEGVGYVVPGLPPRR